MSDLGPWLRAGAPFAVMWLLVLAVALGLDSLVRFLARSASAGASATRAARIIVWTYLLTGALSSTVLNGSNVYDQLTQGSAAGESMISLWLLSNAALYPLLLVGIVVWWWNEPRMVAGLLLFLLLVPLSIAVGASVWITRPGTSQ